jgi:tetratricopeptide (TPR) repeat protein
VRKIGFNAAEQWYFKSLETKEKLNDEIGMAETYFNLSTNARDQNNNEAAEEWLGKALQIFEKRGDAKKALQSARIAGQAHEFGVAEKACRKALEIAKKNGDDMCEAYSYQYLGSFAWQQGDYKASREWYEKAFEAHEKRSAMDEAAKMCIALGHLSFAVIVGRQRDLDSAARWFRKSLEIDANVTWRKRLTLYARLWHYRLLSFLSK